MNTESKLIYWALGVSAEAGAVAENAKKAIFHEHGIDWSLVRQLARTLEHTAAELQKLADSESERATQPALDFGDMLPGDMAECAMCDTAGVERLSNVTIGPGAP